MKKFYNTVKKFTFAFVVAALGIFSYMYGGGWRGKGRLRRVLWMLRGREGGRGLREYCEKVSRSFSL